MGNSQSSGNGYRFSTTQRDLRSDSIDPGTYPIANLSNRIVITGTDPIFSLVVVTMLILAMLAGLVCYLEKRKQGRVGSTNPFQSSQRGRQRILHPHVHDLTVRCWCSFYADRPAQIVFVHQEQQARSGSSE